MAANRSRIPLHSDVSAWQRVLPRGLFATIVFTAAACTTIAALIRLAWPYRLELAALTLLGTGWYYGADYTGHTWWGLALLVLVLATIVGPFVAWRRTRRHTLGVFRRAHTRRQFRAGMKELRTANSSGRLPKIRRVRSTPVGERMTLHCRPGQSAELLDSRVEELRAAVKARDVRVARDLSASHRVTIDVVRRDPLAAAGCIDWADHDAETLSLWDPIHLGRDENGEDMRLSLVERSLFIGGEPGSGKSSELNVVVSHAAKSWAHLVLIDPNEVQFGPWEDRALAFAGADPDDAIAAVQLVRDEITRRRELLRSLPGVQRKLTREIAEAHNLPPWLFAIDELAFHTSVVGTPAQQKAFNTATRDVVARCRAFGIIPVFATQRPTSDVVPTSLRDLFSLRCALRTTTAASSDVILGEGWARRGYSATEIDLTNRGVAWLLAEGQTPRRIKATWIPDDTIADLSVNTIRNRPDAPADLPVIDFTKPIDPPSIPQQRTSDDDNTRHDL